MFLEYLPLNAGSLKGSTRIAKMIEVFYQCCCYRLSRIQYFLCYGFMTQSPLVKEYAQKTTPVQIIYASCRQRPSFAFRILAHNGNPICGFAKPQICDSAICSTIAWTTRCPCTQSRCYKGHSPSSAPLLECFKLPAHQYYLSSADSLLSPHGPFSSALGPFTRP